MAEVEVEMKTVNVILKFPMNVEAPYKWLKDNETITVKSVLVMSQLLAPLSLDFSICKPVIIFSQRSLILMY